MIFESIESFRVHKQMSVQDFCEITQISPSRYSKYKHGSFQFLMISDAVRLISAFTGEINVNILLKWTGEKPLPLSGKFPEFAFAYEPASDSGKSEQIFRRFLISTAFDVFPELLEGEIKDLVSGIRKLLYQTQRRIRMTVSRDAEPCDLHCSSLLSS